jgi:lysophospholipase L1-like esterase
MVAVLEIVLGVERMSVARLFVAGFLVAGSVLAQTPVMTGTWATAPVQAVAKHAGEADQTVRDVVHVSIGSADLVTVQLTNEFGLEPLTVGAASVALRQSADTVSAPVALTFKGQVGVVIPPGKFVWSDPVKFAFAPMSDVAVSVFVPAQPMTFVSQHNFADATNYIAPGNQTAALTLTDAAKLMGFRYVKSVSVSTGSRGAVLCFGDSITDGSKSTLDTNQRWPDYLAKRLAANPATANLGVMNVGIGGNRIVRFQTGPSAIERFDHDVLELPNVKYMILLEGINDIGHSYDLAHPYDHITAAELIAADRLLIARAHANGIRIIGATLTPYRPSGYSSPAGEVVREALNHWIRTGGEFDGVIDFEKAAADPAAPTQYLPAFDSGDHLHPNDAGMKAMADAIDLSLFAK